MCILQSLEIEEDGLSFSLWAVFIFINDILFGGMINGSFHDLVIKFVSKQRLWSMMVSLSHALHNHSLVILTLI